MNSSAGQTSSRQDSGGGAAEYGHKNQRKDSRVPSRTVTNVGGRTGSMTRNAQRLIPAEILINGVKYNFKIDDEIFKVQKPRTAETKTTAPKKCKVCQQELDKNFVVCDYCGKPAHKYHSRER